MKNQQPFTESDTLDLEQIPLGYIITTAENFVILYLADSSIPFNN